MHPTSEKRGKVILTRKEAFDGIAKEKVEVTSATGKPYDLVVEDEREAQS